MSARPNTTVEHVETENAVVVTVRGEIDAANAPELADGITSGTALAVAVGARLLVVDMSAVRFCGSRALVALVNGQREAKESGYDLVVVAPEHGVVENVLILTGLISSTTVRISLDHAFLAAR